MRAVADHSTPAPRSLETERRLLAERVESLVDEVVELSDLDSELEQSYGIESLGLAAAFVAGKSGLDPSYVPKLIELVDQRNR